MGNWLRKTVATRPFDCPPTAMSNRVGKDDKQKPVVVVSAVQLQKRKPRIPCESKGIEEIQ